MLKFLPARRRQVHAEQPLEVEPLVRLAQVGARFGQLVHLPHAALRARRFSGLRAFDVPNRHSRTLGRYTL
jgi:hypothetical protein